MVAIPKFGALYAGMKADVSLDQIREFHKGVEAALELPRPVRSVAIRGGGSTSIYEIGNSRLDHASWEQRQASGILVHTSFLGFTSSEEDPVNKFMLRIADYATRAGYEEMFNLAEILQHI